MELKGKPSEKKRNAYFVDIFVGHKMQADNPFAIYVTILFFLGLNDVGGCCLGAIEKERVEPLEPLT